MAVKLRVAKVEGKSVDYLAGYVEVDGKDISYRVQRVELDGSPMDWRLVLTIPLRPGDEVDFDGDDDIVSVALVKPWLRS